MIDDNKIKQGLSNRREVMGDQFVDRAMSQVTEFSKPLQDWVNGQCWGETWQRTALDRKTRSLVTLAILTTLRASQEIKGHTRGALNNGATTEEIQDVLLHCGVYAGTPAAIEGFRSAAEVLEEDNLHG